MAGLPTAPQTLVAGAVYEIPQQTTWSLFSCPLSPCSRSLTRSVPSCRRVIHHHRPLPSHLIIALPLNSILPYPRNERWHQQAGRSERIPVAVRRERGCKTGSCELDPCPSSHRLSISHTAPTPRAAFSALPPRENDGAANGVGAGLSERDGPPSHCDSGLNGKGKALHRHECRLKTGAHPRQRSPARAGRVRPRERGACNEQ